MTKIRAAILIIGNEVLSGRVQDKNSVEIINRIADLGISVAQIRVVPDIEQQIIDHVRELKNTYDYVFTTGGIGPTHDDITTESVAKALNLDLIIDDQVRQDLEDHYKKSGQTLNESRIKMATFPKGSILLHNEQSSAPGFMIDNIVVMAGITTIMKAMLEASLKYLQKGDHTYSDSVRIDIIESEISQELSDLQEAYPDVEIGSYPFTNGQRGAEIVFRSANKSKIASAMQEFNKKIQTGS